MSHWQRRQLAKLNSSPKPGASSNHSHYYRSTDSPNLLYQTEYAMQPPVEVNKTRNATLSRPKKQGKLVTLTSID